MFCAHINCAKEVIEVFCFSSLLTPGWDVHLQWQDVTILIPLAQLIGQGIDANATMLTQVLIVFPDRELTSQIVTVVHQLLEGTDLRTMLEIRGATWIGPTECHLQPLGLSSTEETSRDMPEQMTASSFASKADSRK
jgi:hypothetical protein